MLTCYCGEPIIGQQRLFIVRIILHDYLINIYKYGTLHVVENTEVYFLVSTFCTYTDRTPIKTLQPKFRLTSIRSAN